MIELTRGELLRRVAWAGATLALPAALTACDTGEKRQAWFRAPSAGDVPTSRRPRLGSVTLPTGRAWVPEETYGPVPRRPVAWVTDAGTDDGFSLARTLAD